VGFVVVAVVVLVLALNNKQRGFELEPKHQECVNV